MKCRYINKAFTLVELIIVIAIITLLASMIIIVINPASIFANAKNSQRSNDITAIKEAITRYLVDTPVNGTLRTINDLTGYTSLLSDAIINSGGICNNAVNGMTYGTTITGAYDLNNSGTNFLDLSVLINNNYLAKILKDPLTGNPYKACIDLTNNNELVFYAINNESTTNNPLVFFPIIFEGKTTNYISNPSAEVDTNHWSCYDNPTNCTLSRITTDHKVGSASFRFQAGGSGFSSIIFDGTLTSLTALNAGVGSTFCYSAFIKVNSGGSYLLAYALDHNRTITATYPLNTVTLNTWNRYSMYGTVPASTTSFDIKVVDLANSDAEFDGIMFETNRTTVSSYTDGTLGSNYIWSGTANDSASIRLK